MTLKQSRWYILKQEQGQCDIVPASEVIIDSVAGISSASDENEAVQHWGPFDSEAEAIARRVGLIRAGKCKPA